MHYAVCAFVEFETVFGVIEESPEIPVNVRTTGKAEKVAREMYETGKYSSIYIEHKNGGYWNPAVGFSPTGKNWVKHFEAQ